MLFLFNLFIESGLCGNLALAVAAVGSRSPSTSEGNFFAISEYGGVPTREIDERWDNLTESKLSALKELHHI